MMLGRLLGALLLLLAAAAAAGALAAEPMPPPIVAFSLADVELAEGSEFRANFEQTAEYLLLLEPDNLLFNFRKTAGLDAPGESYGGWEWSDSEVRGQFIGHYLSAVAMAAQHTGRPELRDRCDLMVRELQKVQEAFGNGYLAAFPESHFDRLEALQPVWVPYYVVHKLMQGLLDQHSLAGQGEALKMVRQMADYFCARVQHVIDVNGTDHWHKVLETEFGGMNEALVNLYAVTADDAHAECAAWFVKPAFFDPLVQGQDPLPSLHANTHLAQVQGFAARYEALGDTDSLTAAGNFYSLLLQHHSFSTVGSNWYEHWGAEDSLGEALNNTDASALTEESCTQYNVLKLTRFLFRHTGDPALADIYERAMLNGVIGVQKMRPHSHAGHAHGAHSHPHGSHSHSHPHPQPAAVLAASAEGVAASAASTEAALHVPNDSGAAEGRRRRPGSEGSKTHNSAVWRNDSHPHITVEPRRTTHIHIHNSHFTNATSEVKIFIGSKGGDDGGDGDEVFVSGEERRRRLLGGQEETLRAAALARPEHYQVASWPGEPYAAARDGDSPAGPGVYIYFQPLGAGISKGDKAHSWSHGWGNAFDTFWCCYGTGARAVESFSKLADSIFFKHMPDISLGSAPSRPSATPSRTNTPGGAGGAAGGRDHAGSSAIAEEGPLPELYVNQLVSSSVRWRELRLVARQEADIYGPGTAAVARLTLDIYPPSEGEGLEAAGPVGGGDARRFILNWRIPGWAKASEVELRINGKNYTQCALGGDSGHAPQFGQGARFCSLGASWSNGDVVEAVMPMRVRAEELNDGRKALRGLKAILLGPLVMAGLTDGEHDLELDPARVEEALFLPEEEGLVSLAAAQDQGGAQGQASAPLLRLCGGALQLGGGCAGGAGAPLDATFRLVAPLAGCGAASAAAEACSPARTRQLLMAGPSSQAEGGLQRGGAGEGGGAGAHVPLASFESASRPGHFLTVDPASGRLVLQQPRAAAAGASSRTFRLRPLLAPGGGFSLEPLSRPGASVAALGGGRGLGLRQAGAGADAGAGPPPLALQLAPPAAAAYPPGARVVHGRNRDYLLLPIGQIADESYTAYFNFVEEQGEQEGQQEQAGGAAANAGLSTA